MFVNKKEYDFVYVHKFFFNKLSRKYESRKKDKKIIEKDNQKRDWRTESLRYVLSQYIS